MAHQKWKLLQVTWLPRDTATWTGWSQMESTGGEGQKCEGLSFDSNVPPDPEADRRRALHTTFPHYGTSAEQKSKMIFVRPCETDCAAHVTPCENLGSPRKKASISPIIASRGLDAACGRGRKSGAATSRGGRKSCVHTAACTHVCHRCGDARGQSRALNV